MTTCFAIIGRGFRHADVLAHPRHARAYRFAEHFNPCFASA